MNIFSLPDNFIISNRVQKLSDEERESILTIGEHIYFNGHDFYNTNENEKLTYAFNKQIEEIRLSTDKQIKDHTQAVQNQYDYLMNGKDELIISKQSEIDDMRNRILKLEEENCQALSLSGKLDSLMGKGNTVDNAMKGDFGESIVASQIQHWFQTSEIEDKSAETAKGDLLWKLNRGEFRALVEVKNVQMVRPIEVQKFERDIILNTNDKSCNCGIFVSLKTETIPNKGKFKLEFLNDCPVIYVSNILEDLNTLRFALDSLYSIQKKMKQFENVESENDENSIEEIMVDFVQKQFKKVENLKTNITQMKLYVETLSNCILTEENIVRELSDNIISLRSDHDIFKQIDQEYKSNSRGELKDSILNDMKQFYNEHAKMPMMCDLLHKYKRSEERRCRERV